MSNDIAARMASQNAEFDAARELAKQMRRIELTPVVDDDYPAVRFDYERAVRSFIEACRANGRECPTLQSAIAAQEGETPRTDAAEFTVQANTVSGPFRAPAMREVKVILSEDARQLERELSLKQQDYDHERIMREKVEHELAEVRRLYAAAARARRWP